MPTSTSHSVLRDAALASGLLSPQQIDDAVAGLLAASSGAPITAAQITDDELGRRLVDSGYLNRWQVEQLKEGRTKFTLGPYRIVNAIGKGGMGHVFKAEHKLLGRIEAIKVLPKCKSTPEAVAAFQREIRAQAQLDHPNLVRVSYADFEGDTYFFVTEYVPGTDLRKLVRRNGPIPYGIAATIVSQAADGLHYAHRRGLVHRDVKPGNLLVTPDGRTKITDLGLAWFLMEELESAKPALKGNTLVGTADYLAPESIRQPDKIMPVSDVYALGCTLYYAVTGKVPFPGGNTADKIRRHLDETPLNPLHFNPDLPKGFCDAIAAMMEKNPDKRTPTAAAVEELLRPWRDENVTRHLAAETPPSSGIYFRANAPVQQPPTGLDETASYVLDDEPIPGQIDSPSQISQGTVSISAENEETLAGVMAVRRASPRTASHNTAEPAPSGGRKKAIIAAAILIAATAAAAAAWVAGLF
jgi:serine/threonine protein kinase